MYLLISVGIGGLLSYPVAPIIVSESIFELETQITTPDAPSTPMARTHRKWLESNGQTSEHERVKEMTSELSVLIKSGASRPGATGTNDCQVRFDITQTYRWVED